MSNSGTDVEYKMRWYELFLPAGLVLLGLGGWTILEEMSGTPVYLIAGVVMTGSFFYWVARPVVRVTGDRIVYNPGLLRGEREVLRKDVVGAYFSECTWPKKEAIVVHVDGDEPLRIKASQIEGSQREQLTNLLQTIADNH